MRLLVVTQYFAPENFRVNDLVQGLTDKGHQVTVLTGQPNYPAGRFFPGYGWRGPRRESIGGAEVVRVPLVARADGGAGRLIFNYLSFVLFASYAARFRLHGRFDAIFVFEPSPITVGIPAVFASRRFKAPILFWVLDLWPESLSATGAIRSSMGLRLVGKLVRWIYRNCARVLVQSKGFIQNVAAHGVPLSHIRYFPNWIETEYAQADWASIDTSDEREGELFRVVFAGNIGTAQDFPAILAAAEIIAGKMPNVRWVIAGDGRMSDWLRDEVERRGLVEYFQFLGQLPSVQMPALFETADALLVTLRADPVFALTIPGKIQSYLAAGKPVLAMLDGEGARVVVESGGGLSCRAGDSFALAELLLRLARMDVVQRKEMGEMGQEYARREFGREFLFERLNAWFIEAIEEYKG